jgi:MFS family permease
MGEPLEHGRGRLSTVFRNRGYRRLWVARTVSQWGDVVNFVALALLVFDLTGSGLGVAGVVAAEILPVLLFAPFAGVIVDRSSRVRVMVIADLVRAALALGLALGQHHVATVYVLAFGLSAGTVFFNPAASSALPSLVDEEELVAANSGIWTAAVLSQIALAPIAGVLVAEAGFGAAFLVNAASFLASALVLLRLRLPGQPTPITGRRWLVDSRDGASAITRDATLRALAIGQLLAALSAGATSALLVVLAREHLMTDSRGYGLLLAAIGVGAAVGPLLLVRFIRKPRRLVFVFGPYALRGLVDLVLASTRTLPAASGALAVYGVGTSTGAVTFNSLLQASVSDRQRGRVFATFDLLWQLGRLASLLAGGVLADLAGIRAVYYAGGVLLLAAALAGVSASRNGYAPDG